MKLRFTKYGSIDMLWFLIPIFPVWTVIPGVFMAMQMGDLFKDCETGYRITAGCFICLIPLSLFLFRFYIYDRIHQLSEKAVRNRHRAFNLLLYSLINTVLMIGIIGIKNCCEGDGQTILAVIFSGPLAGLTLPVAGWIADYYTTYYGKNKL